MSSLAVLTLTALVSVVFGYEELIELSYTYLYDAPTMPTQKALELTSIKKGTNKFGIWVELNEFCTSEHSGSHIDAPVHFSRDGWTVDHIPLDRLYRRPAIKVDVSAKASRFKNFNNYEVEVRDFERWESANGIIPDGAVVFIHTGWGALHKNITAYSGEDQYGKFNFPGLSLELARWLASHGHENGHEHGIIGVGIDTLSLDVGNSIKYESHVKLLGHNIYGLENVANTDKLPAKDFLVTVLPLKIGGGSGSPVRIIAEIGGTAPAPIVTQSAACAPSLSLLACASVLLSIIRG
ncbi:Kynurenine formamidase [Trinorchestia longiramus]|nr:Kynurenine formamidase [Trinorchestia longiramus]